MRRTIIELDQGWDIMQRGITKLIRILEALPEQQFTSEENILLYTTIYNMCTQDSPRNYSQQLYDKCREVFKAYTTSMVLPALREKHGEFMLRELVKRWINHKVMVRWFSRIFHYLDRIFVGPKSRPTLHEVGLACFRDLIHTEEINGKVKDALISLIDQERQGEQIDRALLKNIFDIFVEIGLDFEEPMLSDTAASYYSQKENWIIENDSCPDYMNYMLKALKIA